MKKNTIFILITILTAILSFGANVSVKATSSQTIIGQVTMVGQDILKIREDATQVEYELKASPNQLKNLVTGYRAEVKATDGRVSSLTILGMPMKAESQPFQKWTIIKYPQ